MAGKGGGGAWKVAYADFVTAMMAFFLVMWITSQSQKVKEAIAHSFNAPYDSRTPSRGGEHRAQRAQSKLASPQSVRADAQELAMYKPHGQSTRKSNPMHTATMIFFADDSAALDDQAQERLKRLVPWIAGKPQKIEIRGHTSRQPQAANTDHVDPWQLSYARCQAASQFLEEQGIPADRIRLSQAAGNEPYSTRVEPQWQARNSRVEVYLLNEYVQDLIGTRDEGDGPAESP